MTGAYRVGAAAAGVVTLQEAKEHIKFAEPDQDSLIDVRIAAAVSHVAAVTGRVLGLETWRWSVPSASGPIVVPVAPVVSLQAITYIDADWQVQAADVADFALIMADPDRPMIAPRPGRAWPSAARRDDAITITVAAGSADMDPALRTAVLMLVGHWFEHREAIVAGAMSEIPMGVPELLEAHRRTWIVA